MTYIDLIPRNFDQKSALQNFLLKCIQHSIFDKNVIVFAKILDKLFKVFNQNGEFLTKVMF